MIKINYKSKAFPGLKIIREYVQRFYNSNPIFDHLQNYNKPNQHETEWVNINIDKPHMYIKLYTNKLAVTQKNNNR